MRTLRAGEVDVSELPIRCSCGEVRGAVRLGGGMSRNRVVCYCDDCQTWAWHLGRADLLDEHGGTDIVQCAPAQVTITAGADRLACYRLSPKGLLRWATTCCNTPFGNMLEGAGMPFVGLPAAVFAEDGGAPPEPLHGRVQGRFAVGTPPDGTPDRMGAGLMARTLAFMIAGRLAGRHRPSPWRDAAGAPIAAPVVLTREERAAAKAKIGGA